MALVYLFALLALGLFISTRAQDAGARRSRWRRCFLLPSIFLSGYIFPFAGLPLVAAMRSAQSCRRRTWSRSCAASCCATPGPSELLPHVLALALISTILVALSVRNFRKVAV